MKLASGGVSSSMKTSGLKKRLGGNYYYSGDERKERDVLEQWVPVASETLDYSISKPYRLPAAKWVVFKKTPVKPYPLSAFNLE